MHHHQSRNRPELIKEEQRYEPSTTTMSSEQWLEDYEIKKNKNYQVQKSFAERQVCRIDTKFQG